MLRTMTCALVALGLYIGLAATEAHAAKAQMVRGTIKSVSPETNVLIINQKVGNATVDRELSITEDAEFSITSPQGTEEVSGKAGLKLLQGAEGATVQVKCDKDVNVLKVTVKITK